MRSLLSCNEAPLIDPEVLSFFSSAHSSTFACMHHAEAVVRGTLDMSDSDVPRERWARLLSSCYSMVRWQSLDASLATSVFADGGLAVKFENAMCLEACCKWREARASYEEIMLEMQRTMKNANASTKSNPRVRLNSTGSSRLNPVHTKPASAITEVLLSNEVDFLLPSVTSSSFDEVAAAAQQSSNIEDGTDFLLPLQDIDFTMENSMDTTFDDMLFNNQNASSLDDVTGGADMLKDFGDAFNSAPGELISASGIGQAPSDAVSTAPSFRTHFLESITRRWFRCCRAMHEWNVLDNYNTLHSDVVDVEARNRALRLSDWQGEHLQNVYASVLKETAYVAPQGQREDKFIKTGRVLSAPFQRMLSCVEVDDVGAKPSKASASEMVLDAMNKYMADWTWNYRFASRLEHDAWAPGIEDSFLLQALVEADEGEQIMKKVSSKTHKMCKVAATTGDSYINSIESLSVDAELLDKISVWRSRTPSQWESTAFWDLLFSWRMEVFDATSDALHGACGKSCKAYTLKVNASSSKKKPAEHKRYSAAVRNALLSLSDVGWSAVRLAKAARKHGMNDVCLQALDRVPPDSNLRVSDALSKLREQALVCLNSDTDVAKKTGLTLLNHTNLELCPSNYKAEFFKIKAQLLEALGLFDGSQKLFFVAGILHTPSTAYQKAGKTWLTWARCVDSLWMENKSDGVNAMDLRECAFSGYLQSLVHGSNSAKFFVSRILALIFDQASTSRLCEVLNKHIFVVPPRQWLPWIPQLIVGMERPGYECISVIIARIAATYPQNIYMRLKALEKTMSETYNSFVLQGKSEAAEAMQGRLDKLDEIVSYMNGNHGAMAYEANILFDELLLLGKNMRTRGELRTALVVFMNKCETKSADISSDLDSMCQNFFRVQEWSANFGSTFANLFLNVFHRPRHPN